MTFIAPDNTSIEIELHRSPDERCCLVVIPCMGGSFRMYRAPVGEFTSRGISLLLYNPRGHGLSGGDFSLQSAMDDLAVFIEDCLQSDTPLFIMGHSGGAALALSFGCVRPVAGFHLVAPVLDSRESLFYMYDRGTIVEFNSIISMLTDKPGVVMEVLSDRAWLDMDYWNRNDLEEKLDGISRQVPVGALLRNIFLPGICAVPHLVRFRESSSVILCRDDHWYPGSTILSLCGKHGIPFHVIGEAKDHFFTGGWPDTWAHILGCMEGANIIR